MSFEDIRHEAEDQDDDVQFLYHSQNTIECPTCSLDLTHMTPQAREMHCNEHFADEPQAGPSSEMRPQSTGQRIKSILFNPSSYKPRSSGSPSLRVQRDIFWRSSQTAPPPSNYTPGLIPLLKKSLLKSHEKGSGGTQKAYLCAPGAVHITSETWDKGWGCGYRNYLMACAALMNQDKQSAYPALLEKPDLPGVYRLQKLIEQAWDDGFDAEGATQLKHKLYGTSKWIGTAELYVAFTYKGIPARLVDFELKKLGVDGLVKWVTDYFSPDPQPHGDINQVLLGASPVVVTDRLPLVLQHSGHSRTVVGYERRRDGVYLLMFDPSKAVPAWLRDAALESHSSSGDNNQAAKRSLSPSKLVKKVLHPVRNGRKRPASPPNKESAAKRVRAGAADDAIVIDSDDESDAGQPESARNALSTTTAFSEQQWLGVANMFRVKAKDLNKDKYQILCFPLTEPLTASERRNRKVVTSKKVI